MKFSQPYEWSADRDISRSRLRSDYKHAICLAFQRIRRIYTKMQFFLVNCSFIDKTYSLILRWPELWWEEFGKIPGKIHSHCCQAYLYVRKGSMHELDFKLQRPHWYEWLGSLVNSKDVNKHPNPTFPVILTVTFLSV